VSERRLFVGVRVAVGTANALAGAAETLARRSAGIAVRWVPPVNYHVTLRFLGATREAAIVAVRDMLAVATGERAREPLQFKTARLGAFANLDRAHVIWAGVDDPSGGLGALAARVEQGAVALGYAPGSHPFHAHVTLGRLRESRSVRELVLPLAEQMFGETRVDTISLFESETKSSGSVYREIHRIDLKTGTDRPANAEKRQTPALQLSSRELDDAETDDGWPRGHVPKGSDSDGQ
jgi:RNA 2',3'-cyclic 3'-phosphodiesterase